MWRYALLLIFTNLIWAGTYSVIKWGVADVSPLALVFYRMAFAAVVLWLTVLLFFRKELRGLNRSFSARMSIIIFLDLAYHVGLMIGVKFSSAADASLIVSMEPVFLFFLATIVLRENFGMGHIAAIVTAMLGFMILSNLGSFSLARLAAIQTLGNLIILAAVISEAGFSVIFCPLVRSHSAVVMMAIVTVTQSALLGPAVYFLDPAALKFIMTAKGFMVVAYLGPVSTVLGYTIWLVAMRRIPVNIMALSLFLQPAFGPVIAGLSLGERLGPRVLVGGAFIILSLYIVLAHQLSPTFSTGGGNWKN